MKKIFKKYGGTVVLTFSSEDMRANGYSIGDIADLSDIIVTKPKKKVKNDK